MRAVLLVLALVAGAFAGCTEDPEPKRAAIPDAQDDAAARGVRVSISGHVTYEFQPVAGARVVAEPEGDETTTDDEGYYELSVLPGRYVVRAEAKGFPASSVLVEAYNHTNLDLPFRSPPRRDPYHRTIPFRGFMECSVAAPGVSAYGGGQGTSANCVAVQVPSSLQPPSNDRHVFLFDADSNLSSLVVEVAWEPGSNAAATRFLVLLEQAGSRGEAGLVHKRTSGSSPVRLELAPEEVAKAALGAGGALQVRVFVDAGAAPGLAVQQDFRVAATLFYFAPHAAGFTALA